MSPTDVIFSKSKKSITEKLTKRHETQTCSATYHNKSMDQVSVQYVKEYPGGKKKSENPLVGWTDGWRDRQRANL